MISKSRSMLLAATLLAVPMASALAQQNNPVGNMGSNRSMTASPGTADNHAASGTNTGDVGSGNDATGNYSSSALNGNTHASAVPGTNSSVASAGPATRQQQTGSQTTGGK